MIDVLILTKDAAGTVEATELSDVADLGELQVLEAELGELLAAEDVEHLAAAMEPGSTAGVLIWENQWAAPFASAVRHSGGQLIADGRIPIQASSPRSKPTTPRCRRLRGPSGPVSAGQRASEGTGTSSGQGDATRRWQVFGLITDARELRTNGPGGRPA